MIIFCVKKWKMRSKYVILKYGIPYIRVHRREMTPSSPEPSDSYSRPLPKETAIPPWSISYLVIPPWAPLYPSVPPLRTKSYPLPWFWSLDMYDLYTTSSCIGTTIVPFTSENFLINVSEIYIRYIFSRN